jgi:hypothetical protein
MIVDGNQGQNCLFRRGDYRSKGYNPQKISVLGSSPGEDVRLRIISFSYDYQRYISNDETYDKLSGNEG